jgi:mono/diheme cytochrome c family protein
VNAPKPRIYGVLAEFSKPEDLLAAAHRTRLAGYRMVDAFTPFPIHGLSDAIGFHKTRLPLIVLLGGIVGAIGGFLLQYYTAAIDYPLNIGGRPLNSWPSFIVITFECTVLAAALSAVLGMLALNGLPQPYHPLFNVPQFELASRTHFFLVIKATDPRFGIQAVSDFLRSLNPGSIAVVPTDRIKPPKQLAAVLVLLAMFLTIGCDRNDMHDDAQLKPYEASSFFADGMSSRPLVEGTVPRPTPGVTSGEKLITPQLLSGDAFPIAITSADLARGQQRYNIYCTPCHGATGNGDGMIVRRGFTPPPTYHQPRLRQAPAGHFVAVMTNGWGAMFSYSDRVDASDRWRIAAYIRALQVSQQVDPGLLSDEERRLLAAAPTTAPAREADPHE